MILVIVRHFELFVIHDVCLITIIHNHMTILLRLSCEIFFIGGMSMNHYHAPSPHAHHTFSSLHPRPSSRRQHTHPLIHHDHNPAPQHLIENLKASIAEEISKEAHIVNALKIISC